MLTKEQRDEWRTPVAVGLDDDLLFETQERAERGTHAGTGHPRNVADLVEAVRIARERIPALLDALDEMERERDSFRALYNAERCKRLTCDESGNPDRCGDCEACFRRARDEWKARAEKAEATMCLPHCKHGGEPGQCAACDAIAHHSE